MLINILRCDNNIEELRKSLASTIDFTIRDAWLIFERASRDNINTNEIN